MEDRVQKFFAQLSYLPRTFDLIWQSAGRWTIAWGVCLVLQGLLPAAAVYLTRPLVDAISAAMGSGGDWDLVSPALYYAAWMVAVIMATDVIQAVNGWVSQAQAELIKDHISRLIHEQCAAVDLAFFESPECHDSLDRVQTDLGTRPLALLESVGSLLQNGITMAAVAVLLVPYGWWLPGALILSTVPALLVVIRHNRRYYDWWRESTPDRRRARYYEAVLTISETAPELRLFELGGHFGSAYQSLRRRLREARLKLTRDQGIARLTAGFTGLLISGLAIGWMLWGAVSGRATIGDLALFYHALSRGQNLMHSLLRDIGQIYNNILFVGNLFEFLGLKPKVVNPGYPVPAPRRLESGIKFSGVTFRYPGSERVILRHLNMTIPAGKVVAFLGPNGAGKSTVIKLLCRFYDPEEGRIEIDGTDVRNFALGDLRQLITVLFQWPVSYHLTAEQNIAIGDLHSAPNRARVEAAARSAGAHEVVARLPNGYDTQLGKWFINGTELSRGEWQRLALARAFLRQGQILILDEPTSSLDVWSEVDWFDRFRLLAAGRTAIVITHRLPIARRADLICVIADGGVLESGTHEELLAAGGLYAESWLSHPEDSPAFQRSRSIRGTGLNRVK
jgi:ATP-binding cassette, subfamily B, bacterial